MDFLALPNEIKYTLNRTNASNEAAFYEDAHRDTFDKICKLLSGAGYDIREERNMGESHIYRAYSKANEGVFVNYFAKTGELSVVSESDCRYFDFCNELKPAIVNPAVSQLYLEDFGMSYAVRLSDGRYIIIDGGREFESDADRLYKLINTECAFDKPVIAAWIMTHPHEDHFHCFLTFWEKYKSNVVIEKFFYNFPSHDDLEHYPAMTRQDFRFDHDTTVYTTIVRMEEYIKESGALVYVPHTGQKYTVGDASVEIMACMDDTVHKTDYINAISLVMKMELGGQTIFWGGDAGFSLANIPDRYETYLKSDILQVPHHGFQMGDPDSEIAGYKYIKPSVCFLPASEYNAYYALCTHMKGARFIMEDLDIDELITGDTTETILLPYTPPAYKKNELIRKYSDGLKSCGSKTWVFSELNTGNSEDMVFTFLNTTHAKAKVWIELYFEDTNKNIRYLTAYINPCCIQKVDITQADDNDVWFNWMSVKDRGISENSPFAVRFLSSLPIVVSNKNHKGSYKD